MPAERGFIDTNVLVYNQTDDDPGKALQTEAVILPGNVISVQVLNELANVLVRKARWPWEAVRESLTLTRAILEVVPLTEDIHESGLRLAERYSLSIYDAMIVAAALESGCDVLWSENMQDGQIIEGRLRIRNPFL